MNISKATMSSSELILNAWIDNFTLLHFSVTQSGGFAHLRGSNQDIGFGTITGTYPAVGNPGVRDACW